MKRTLTIAMMLLLTVAVAVAMEATVFNHEVHLEEGYADECSYCHQEGDFDIVPPTERCEECHESEFIEQVTIPATVTHDSFWYRDHDTYAKEQDRNCAQCHRDDYCLDCHKAGFADEQGKLNIHRSEFLVTHPIMARADNRSCSACHEESFCTDCHDDFAPADLAFQSHRRGFSDIDAFGSPHGSIPVTDCQVCHTDSVLPTHEWSDSHAREARRSLPTCQACHPNGDVCITCHSAREGLIVNPHPEDWDDMKDYLDGASDGRTCRRCH